MSASRRIAIIVGVFYLTVNIIAGPLGLVFTEPTLNAPDYLIKVSENETEILVGALFLLIMAVADSGIAIAVYPVLKNHNSNIAIGYVGARIVESVIFILDVISLLVLLTLRSRPFLTSQFSCIILLPSQSRRSQRDAKKDHSRMPVSHMQAT